MRSHLAAAAVSSLVLFAFSESVGAQPLAFPAGTPQILLIADQNCTASCDAELSECYRAVSTANISASVKNPATYHADLQKQCRAEAAVCKSSCG